jgi:hypothetical protein
MSSLVKDPRFELAERRWTEMKTARSEHEQLWEDIARLMRPGRGGFRTGDPGGRTIDKPLSSAPIHANDNFAAGLYGTLTNPANRWFGFRTNNTDLNAWHEGRTWLDHVTDRVLASFGPSVSPFYSAAIQTFGDLSSFGNAVQYDEVDQAERKILDLALSLAEVVWEIDGYGRVVEIVRRFMLTPAQAMSLFKGKDLPAKIVELAEKGDTAKHAFYHHAFKNAEWRPFYKLGVKGKPWLSRYCCEVEGCVISEAGYMEMPFFVPRWQVDAGQTCGLGPGFTALPSARILQRMEDATVRAAQRAADPTLLAPDRQDFPLNGRIRPGEVVYGAVDPVRGNALLQPLQMAGGLNLTLQERQAKLEEVRDAFHYTLMQLAGRTGMTATEVMAITEERQRLWAPHQGRVQEEFLAPKIARRFALLWRAGQIRPPPKEMEGAELRVEYDSAAAAAQRSVEGNATLRVLQDITPLASISPDAAARLGDRLDTDGLLETLMDARGAPARILRSRDAADELAGNRQQMQQAAQMAQMAKLGAGALKDAAGAEAALAGGAPA